MNWEEMDRIIQRYAEERRRETRKVAQEHFLACAYLACSAGEIGQFMKRVRGVLTYHIDCLSLFDNPFRNTQVCWLLLMFVSFVFGIYLMTDDDLRIAGIVLCTGTTIFGASLWKIVWSGWLETSLLIAAYREIIDFIDHLPLSSGNGTTA